MKNWIPKIALLALLFLPVAGGAAALDPRFAEAERLYSEGSYKQAHDAYQKLADNLGNSEDRRWLEFRMAETLARAEAMSLNADDSTGRTAETALRKLVEDNARIDRVVYGCRDAKAGAVDSLFAIGRDPRLNHRFEVVSGVLEEPCREILRAFFQARRPSR